MADTRARTSLTWLAAAFGCAATALAAQIGADSRWLAAVGAAIVRSGRLPHTIPYAAAPSANWHDVAALGQPVARWATLPGGVLLGSAVLAAYLLLHRPRRTPASALAVLALSSGALLATPTLLHTVDYYTAVLGGETAASHYGLWAPLSLRD